MLFKDGKDVMLATDADKAKFVPQIDVSHQMYNNIWPSKHPDYLSSSYLANKRSNARILREKGLTPKHRMYEVRGISHSGGENLPDGKRGDIQILDMSKLMDRFIDMLDAWVERGTAPPPSRSDGTELRRAGDAAGARDARDRLSARGVPLVPEQCGGNHGVRTVHRPWPRTAR